MPRSWRQPPEEQNQDKPPKKIVQALFSRYLRKSYRENVDSLAILRNAELRDVAEQCPTFRRHDRLDRRENTRPRILIHRPIPLPPHEN